MNASKKPLAGLTALVTGAGRGIGRGCAEGLVAAGARVIAVARTRDDVEALERSFPGQLEAWAGDVTSDDLIDRIEALPALHILVNNAGTNRPLPINEVDDDTLDRMLAVNVRAAFRVARAAVRVMLRERISGRIIHMSSQMGHVGAPGRSVYCLSKHAIEGLTKAMAVELAPHGIRVNAVAPTFVETPLVAPMLEDPGFRQSVEARIPLGHIGSVSDVVSAVLFLADPANALVTGHSLRVDGGWTAQ